MVRLLLAIDSLPLVVSYLGGTGARAPTVHRSVIYVRARRIVTDLVSELSRRHEAVRVPRRLRRPPAA
ncbi:hypothetical protein, partial [Verrucosispora sp. SN26_14.1]|uniref:hypothetical protein n=1 Tax=Verrucosispora sp. SN26_14.1 TaxID=2527879 RepID=UPI001F3639F4